MRHDHPAHSRPHPEQAGPHPESDPADTPLGDLMFRVVRRLRRDFAEVTEPLGLAPHHVRALHVVQRGGDEGTRPSAVAERLHVTPRSATDVVDALETKGYVTKAPDENDRRAVRVHLTDAGRDVLATVDADRERLHAEVFAVLTDEERATLHALLAKLV